MKKLKYISYIVFGLSVILFYNESTQGMMKSLLRPSMNPFTGQSKQQMDKAMASYKAEAYNADNGLLTLPQDILMHIFTHCHAQGNDQVMGLEKSIKNFMKLSMACKKFNSMLTPETIGELYKKYNVYTKNKLLQNIAGCTETINYDSRWLPILILIYANVDVNFCPGLLRIAMQNDDVPMMKILLQHNVNPNLKGYSEDPGLFYAKTTEMAQLLIDKGANVHVIENRIYPRPHILWRIIGRGSSDYAPELVTLYLNHKVDPRLLCSDGNTCLLHHVAQFCYKDGDLKKAQLLLNVIPDMINHLGFYNKIGKTPLDMAYASLEDLKDRKKGAMYSWNRPLNYEQELENKISVYEKLIALLRKYGGLTAQELMPIECSLCLETKKLGDCHTMSNCIGASGCSATFCKECLLEHITTHLDEGSTCELRCPNIQCSKKMHESDVQAITQNNKQLYQRFNQIIFDEFVLQNNALIKHCPTSNCTITYSIEDLEKSGRFKCPGCKQMYCSHCRVQHAHEMTCEEAYEHRQRVGNTDKEEVANQKWIAENTKPCPQCKTSIQKNRGCHYMFCRKCGHEFCWQCLQPHDHTMNHPCGLWEDDAQMNQAQQVLIERIQDQNEVVQEEAHRINNGVNNPEIEAHNEDVPQPDVAEVMADRQEQPQEEPGMHLNEEQLLRALEYLLEPIAGHNEPILLDRDGQIIRHNNFGGIAQRNMQQMAQIGQPQELPVINLHWPINRNNEPVFIRRQRQQLNQVENVLDGHEANNIGAPADDHPNDFDID